MKNNDIQTSCLRRLYIPPRVIRTTAICPESPLLAQSVVDSISVQTMGHEIDPHGDYNFDEDIFSKPNWE